jgi:YD repeat-containing protein
MQNGIFMPRDFIDRHDDFNGNLTKVTLPNSVFVEYSYDNAQRLTGIKDSLNNTVTYTLNAAGDATKVEVLGTQY